MTEIKIEDASPSDCKRKRASNWMEEDKILLKELIKEKVAIIENKNTDTNTNNKKKKAWNCIEESFNNMCQGSKRTLAQLKSQWTVTKINAKKEVSDHRKEIPPPATSASLEKLHDNNTESIALKALPLVKSRKKTRPVVNSNVADEKINEVVQQDMKNREELHRLYVLNEEKKSRNLDLEYEILKEKYRQLRQGIDNNKNNE